MTACSAVVALQVVARILPEWEMATVKSYPIERR